MKQFYETVAGLAFTAVLLLAAGFIYGIVTTEPPTTEAAVEAQQRDIAIMLCWIAGAGAVTWVFWMLRRHEMTNQTIRRVNPEHRW